MSVISTMGCTGIPGFSGPSNEHNELDFKKWDFLVSESVFHPLELDRRMLFKDDVQRIVEGLDAFGQTLGSRYISETRVIQAYADSFRKRPEGWILLKCKIGDLLHFVLCFQPFALRDATPPGLKRVNKKKKDNPSAQYEPLIEAIKELEKELPGGPAKEKPSRSVSEQQPEQPLWQAFVKTRFLGRHNTLLSQSGSIFLTTQLRDLRHSVSEFWRHWAHRQALGVKEKDLLGRLLGFEIQVYEEIDVEEKEWPVRQQSRILYWLADVRRHTWKSQLPRPCFIIAGIMFIFITLSLVLGVVFTTSTEYSMSGSFTLAGYAIAVGGLICSFLFASHFSTCECWKKKSKFTTEVEEQGEEIELRTRRRSGGGGENFF